MTTYTDEFAAIAQRTQEATASAVRSWAGVASTYVNGFSAENPLPQPAQVHTLVDTWFDLAGALLAEQRKFAANMIEAGTEAAGTASQQVKTVTDHVRAAAEKVGATD